MFNKTLLRFILLLTLAAGITALLLFRDQVNIESLENWVRDAGAAGPVIFILVYIIGTVLFFPGSVLTLAGGVLFGPVLGTFYNLVGATIGAMVSFIAARYLAHDWVEKKVEGRLKSIKHGVEDEGWKFVAFVRLVPLFPFNLLNYALGITRIKLSHYSITSFICMAPGAIAYTYLGYAGREALAGDEALIQKIMIAIALLAVVSFLPGLLKRFWKKPMVDVKDLKIRIENAEELLLLDVRSKKEYYGEQGHIDGSLLIPLEELKDNLEDIQKYRDKPVLTICRTDVRSKKAARILAGNGFTDVHVVRQGMTAWNNAGY